MWTSTLELDPAHVIPTKLLGLIWRGAYFSSFAPLQVRNLPRQPLPASNWVRVRNSLAGICGSDLHLIFADGDFTIAPAAIPHHGRSYPGHEVVGEVIEVGDDVQHVHVGDRVVLQYGPNCISSGIQHPCRSCASGHYGLCEYGSLPDPQPIGGGWSEEMLLHEQQLFRLPADINNMQGVLLEPSAVAVHAVLRHIPQAKERVLIIGAGTIGLLIVQVVRALAPDAEVSVLARHAFQIEQAARLGANIIYPQDSYRGVQRATGAKFYQGVRGNKMLLGGYDVIYDTIGSAHTTHDALRWARASSTVVMVGLHLHRMRLDLTPIWYQEINLIGTMGHGIETWPIGTYEKKSSFEIAAELIEHKRIFPDKLITHSFPLNGYRDALMTAAKKGPNRAIKVIFDYSKQPPSVVPNVRAAARYRQRAITIPFTSHPSQPLAPDEDEAATFQPQVEEEVPYHIPAGVEREPTSAHSTEGETHAADQVTAFATNDENEGDTIIVSPPKHAHAAVEAPFVMSSINEQEEHAGALDSAATEAEHEIPYTQLEHEATVFSELPSDPVSEEEGTWLQSYSLLPPDEEPTWLQPLPSLHTEEEPTWLQSVTTSQPDEEPLWLQSLTPAHNATTMDSEEEKENSAQSTTNFTDTDRESLDSQFSTPVNSTDGNDDVKTVIVSATKRRHSKRKTGEMQSEQAKSLETDNQEPHSLPEA